MVPGKCKEAGGDTLSDRECNSDADCNDGEVCGCDTEGLGMGYSGAGTLAAFSAASVLVLMNAAAQL